MKIWKYRKVYLLIMSLDCLENEICNTTEDNLDKEMTKECHLQIIYVFLLGWLDSWIWREKLEHKFFCAFYHFLSEFFFMLFGLYPNKTVEEKEKGGAWNKIDKRIRRELEHLSKRTCKKLRRRERVARA